MGCRLIASEAISRAVFVTVDIVSRYRVLSQLQRVGRFLILKAHWGFPRRLPHLLHTVTSPRTGSHKRIVRVTAFLIPFHFQYITQCSVPSKEPLHRAYYGAARSEPWVFHFRCKLTHAARCCEADYSPSRSLATSYLCLLKDSEKHLSVLGFFRRDE